MVTMPARRLKTPPKASEKEPWEQQRPRQHQSEAAAAETQESAPSMGETVGATESAASSVDEAWGAEEAAGDRTGSSESK